MRLPKINLWTGIGIAAALVGAVASNIGDDKRKEEIIRDETRKYIDKSGSVEEEEKTE